MPLALSLVPKSLERLKNQSNPLCIFILFLMSTNRLFVHISNEDYINEKIVGGTFNQEDGGGVLLDKAKRHYNLT